MAHRVAMGLPTFAKLTIDSHKRVLFITLYSILI